MPQKGKGRKAPVKKKLMPDITPPRDELGTSDEVVMSGRVYYAEDRSTWATGYGRQYLASPVDMTDLQHGVVTWMDAATSDKNINEELDLRLDNIMKAREHRKKPPEYEL